MNDNIGRGGKFLAALAGEVQSIPPVWFMRQAGRYLPEYRAVRARAGSFLDLCYNPELAAEVTLQPIRRYRLDAAILFADILLIPHALGQTLSFEEGEGPRLDPPAGAAALDAFARRDIHATLSPVYETVRRCRAALDPGVALIGFAGAPWTVATYMLAGGPSKDPPALRALCYSDRGFIGALLDLLVERTTAYLLAQIDAGADAVQLFDTWAGGLPAPILDFVSIRPLSRIAAAVRAARPGTPVILFPKGVGEQIAEYAMIRDCAGIGVDFSMDPAFARATLSPRKTVQGGLDPLAVVAGGEAMRKGAETWLRHFHDAPYIFNLGHGFTPQTPPEHVGELVDFVRAGAWRGRDA